VAFSPLVCISQNYPGIVHVHGIYRANLEWILSSRTVTDSVFLSITSLAAKNINIEIFINIILEFLVSLLESLFTKSFDI